MNSAKHALAHGEAPNAIEPTQHQCKYCQKPFKPKTTWQAYCKAEHKKSYEKVMSEFISEIRQPLHEAAEKLALARK